MFSVIKSYFTLYVLPMKTGTNWGKADLSSHSFSAKPGTEAKLAYAFLGGRSSTVFQAQRSGQENARGVGYRALLNIPVFPHRTVLLDYHFP